MLLNPFPPLGGEQAWELPWVKPAQRSEQLSNPSRFPPAMVMVAGGRGCFPAAQPCSAVAPRGRGGSGTAGHLCHFTWAVSHLLRRRGVSAPLGDHIGDTRGWGFFGGCSCDNAAELLSLRRRAGPAAAALAAPGTDDGRAPVCPARGRHRSHARTAVPQPRRLPGTAGHRQLPGRGEGRKGKKIRVR